MTDEDLLLLKRVVSTPGALGGKPRIDGTRVGVSHILEALAAAPTTIGASPLAMLPPIPTTTLALSPGSAAVEAERLN